MGAAILVIKIKCFSSRSLQFTLHTDYFVFLSFILCHRRTKYKTKQEMQGIDYPIRLIMVYLFSPYLKAKVLTRRLGNTILVSYRTLDSSRLCCKHLEWHGWRVCCRFLAVSPCYAVIWEFHRSIGTRDTPMLYSITMGLLVGCFYVSRRHGGWFPASQALSTTSTLSPPSSLLKTTPPLIHIVPHMWSQLDERTRVK